MLRCRALDRPLTRLALLAVLLVALAPSVSRVLSAGSTQVLAGWSQLCTVAGLQRLPSPARVSDSTAPAPHGIPAGEDCAYCPLASTLPVLPACLALLVVAHAVRLWPSRPSPRLRAATNLRGLGSRGPPLPL